MKKIAFIGAGSFGFTRNLVRDILSFPALADSPIALMDIDPERLAGIKKAVDKIVKAGNYPAKVIATMDRKEALKDADGVVCTILAGGVKIWRNDVEIPKKYGVDINVGDTRGPSGIFRALRTIPVMLDICRDIERYFPQLHESYGDALQGDAGTKQGARYRTLPQRAGYGGNAGEMDRRPDG